MLQRGSAAPASAPELAALPTPAQAQGSCAGHAAAHQLCCRVPRHARGQQLHGWPHRTAAAATAAASAFTWATQSTLTAGCCPCQADGREELRRRAGVRIAASLRCALLSAAVGLYGCSAFFLTSWIIWLLPPDRSVPPLCTGLQPAGHPARMIVSARPLHAAHTTQPGTQPAQHALPAGFPDILYRPTVGPEVLEGRQGRAPLELYCCNCGYRGPSSRRWGQTQTMGGWWRVSVSISVCGGGGWGGAPQGLPLGAHTASKHCKGSTHFCTS